VGEKVGTGGLAGKRPEMARKAIFSEGRALRVRKYGPSANQGLSSSPTDWRQAGGPKGAMLGLA